MDRIFGNGSASHRTATWEPEPNRRGTFGILSICLVTLSLCVWTAIHLNIPPSEEREVSRGESGKEESEKDVPENLRKKWSWKRFSWTAQTLRKVGWMILGLLAPELVLFTALRQFSDAISLRDIPLEAAEDRADRDPESSPEDRGGHGDKKSKCTLVHGFFAAMGGYELLIKGNYDIFPRERSDKMRFTITPVGLRFLAKIEPAKIPNLSRSVIEDKSKGSMLAKTLVCFQAIWFCTQCITRFAQHLTISLLELNTFGHALCALLMYCLWWHKPLDIGEPEQIELDERFAPKLAAMYMTSKLDRSSAELHVLGLAGERFEFAAETDGSGKIWIRGRGEGHERDGISRFFRFLSPNRAKAIGGPRMYVSIPVGQPDGDVQIHFRGFTFGKMTQFQPDQAGPDNKRIYRQCHSDDEVIEGIDPMFIELANHDIRLWKLALQELCKIRNTTEQDAFFIRNSRNTLTDRIRNFPRFDGVRRNWSLYLGLSITSFIYGGLHCLAWNAPFATDLERLLWRLSSVTASSIGVLVLLVYTWELAPPVWRNWKEAINTPFDAIAKSPPVNLVVKHTYRKIRASLHDPWDDRFESTVLVPIAAVSLFLRTLYDVSIVALIILYCLARCYLVVECFINLAHLPDSAYLLPKWSQYVPHIS